MSGPLYVDSSAVLRAVFEQGMTPAIESRLAGADLLLTSRLSLVETGRAIHRLRRLGETSEARIADVERALRDVWRRCGILEISREVCDLAEAVAPSCSLCSLDAIHLATFVLARREIEDLLLLTTDRRLEEAAGAA